MIFMGHTPLPVSLMFSLTRVAQDFKPGAVACFFLTVNLAIFSVNFAPALSKRILTTNG